ncbi:hypothetical protein [Streptomyces sp. URMC 123]|uniref:hypothetical protein n=1 Tax=Streptomyces sp. URMC 123 TaxID=3423403 RepID=UPI003F1D32B9
MVLEALGSVIIGLAITYGARRWLPDRLPARPLVLATGPVSGLFGGLLTHSAVGPGHALGTLFGALAVGVTLMSLLIRPTGGVRAPHRAARTAAG